MKVVNLFNALIIAIITLCYCGNIVAEELDIDFHTSEDLDGNNVFSNIEPAVIVQIPYDNKELLKDYDQGTIIALNKITANSTKINLKLGESKYFGNIKVALHKCIKNLDPYSEDNLVLLTITEHKIDEDPILLFQGWMMSSSVSLSTFEHPIYEIFIKECF